MAAAAATTAVVVNGTAQDRIMYPVRIHQQLVDSMLISGGNFFDIALSWLGAIVLITCLTCQLYKLILSEFALWTRL